MVVTAPETACIALNASNSDTEAKIPLNMFTGQQRKGHCRMTECAFIGRKSCMASVVITCNGLQWCQLKLAARVTSA